MQISSSCLQSITARLTDSSARWSREGSETSRQGAADVFVPWNEDCKSDKAPTKHHLFHSHFVGRWTFGGVGRSQFLTECHHFKGNIISVGAKESSYWEKWLKDTVTCLICHEHFRCLMYRNKRFWEVVCCVLVTIGCKTTVCNRLFPKQWQMTTEAWINTIQPPWKTRPFHTII